MPKFTPNVYEFKQTKYEYIQDTHITAIKIKDTTNFENETQVSNVSSWLHKNDQLLLDN